MLSTADTQFLAALWQILADSQHKRTLSWNIDGATFTIWSLDTFAQTLLGKYFPSHSFLSFRKRLESLGFVITKQQRKTLQFYQPLFQRTEKQTINLIRRVSIKRKSFVPFKLSAQSSAQEVETCINQLQYAIEKTRRERQVLQSKVSKFLTSFYAEVIKLDLKQPQPRLDPHQPLQVINYMVSPNQPQNKGLVQRAVSTIGEILEKEYQSAAHNPDTVASGDPLSSPQYD